MNHPATLVLLPGLDGTDALLAPFVDALAARLSTCIVSYPGDKYRPRAELVSCVVTGWPAEPVILVGQSYSAAVAVRVARVSPPGLTGVVLVTPSFAAQLPAWKRWGVRALPARLPPPSFLLRWLLCAGDAAVGERLGAAVRTVATPVLAARLKESIRDAAADDPAGLGVPVLALRAGRDRLLGRHDALPRPGTSWRTIDGPHMLLACRPTETAAAVLEFAAAVCGGRG